MIENNIIKYRSLTPISLNDIKDVQSSKFDDDTIELIFTLRNEKNIYWYITDKKEAETLYKSVSSTLNKKTKSKTMETIGNER
ncbi:hypothetical protein ACFL2K_01245 [Candidatus Margulisiibacteriota bacterium]